MILKVQIKQVYGNELVYPVCDQSIILSKLLNSKTFTKRHIDYLKQLNYQFEITSQSI
jgi:hypothetical protein